jgi:nicotinamidase-related amidase
MNHETLVLDIDTQWDLVMPEGAWPVPGVYGLTPNLERVVRYARMYNIPILATTQVRSAQDPAFTTNGGPEPPHCLSGTPGQLKIPATRPAKPVLVEKKPYTPEELDRLVQNGREVVVETSGPDPLSNPNTARLLEGTRTAIVFGVALEGAVARIVQWLLNKGVAVDLVQNAIMPRVPEPEAREALLADLVTLGARKIRDIDIMTRFTTARHR